MQRRYIYNTAVGPFYLAEHDGLFHPVFQGHDLGAYVTARHAADDLARGKTFKTPGVEDTAKLGIPCDLKDWTRMPALIARND